MIILVSRRTLISTPPFQQRRNIVRILRSSTSCLAEYQDLAARTSISFSFFGDSIIIILQSIYLTKAFLHLSPGIDLDIIAHSKGCSLFRMQNDLLSNVKRLLAKCTPLVKCQTITFRVFDSRQKDDKTGRKRSILIRKMCRFLMTGTRVIP